MRKWIVNEDRQNRLFGSTPFYELTLEQQIKDLRKRSVSVEYRQARRRQRTNTNNLLDLLPTTPPIAVLAGPTLEEIREKEISNRLDVILNSLKSIFPEAGNNITDSNRVVSGGGGQGSITIRFNDERNGKLPSSLCLHLSVESEGPQKSSIIVDGLKYPEQFNCLYSGRDLLNRLKALVTRLGNTDLIIHQDASTKRIGQARLEVDLFQLQVFFDGMTWYNKQKFYSDNFDNEYIEQAEYREVPIETYFHEEDKRRLLNVYNIGQSRRGARELPENITWREYGEHVRQGLDKVGFTISENRANDLNYIMNELSFKMGLYDLKYDPNKNIPIV